MAPISSEKNNDDKEEEVRGERSKNLYMDFKIELPSAVAGEAGYFQGSFLTLMGAGEYPVPDTKGQDVLNLEQRLEKVFVDYAEAFSRDSAYFTKFKGNFGPMTKLILPTVQCEELLFCHALFVAWSFVHDDVIDNLVDFRTKSFADGFATVSRANDLFSSILKDEYGQDVNVVNFPEIGNFPILSPLAKSLKYLHSLLHNTIPNYEKEGAYFVTYMEDHFNSNIMGQHKRKIDGRFSEGTALFWLRLTTGYRPWIEMCALLSGVNIPPKIRADFFFKRLSIVGQEFACFVNDLLGAGKDLKNGETDSFVMFKHREKGVGIVEACQQTLDTLNEGTMDMRLLFNVLQEIYPDELGPGDLFRVIKHYCDGYMRWHTTAPRYGTSTTFSFREQQE